MSKPWLFCSHEEIGASFGMYPVAGGCYVKVYEYTTITVTFYPQDPLTHAIRHIGRFAENEYENEEVLKQAIDTAVEKDMRMREGRSVIYDLTNFGFMVSEKLLELTGIETQEGLFLASMGFLGRCVEQVRLGRRIASVPHEGGRAIAAIDDSDKILEILLTDQTLKDAAANYTAT